MSPVQLADKQKEISKMMDLEIFSDIINTYLKNNLSLRANLRVFIVFSHDMDSKLHLFKIISYVETRRQDAVIRSR